MFGEKMLQETAEVNVSEVSIIPKFFEEMQEADASPDIPVATVETEETSVTYLITRNESLEGDVHPITGVPFERQRIELDNGDVVEGVFPEFDPVHEVKIPEDMYTETDYKQFKYCNERLLEAIEENPDLKALFSKEQVEQIKDGVTDGSAPDGYVWHHCPEPGKIQLIDYDTHAGTGHTGGRSVWGGGNENR